MKSPGSPSSRVVSPRKPARSSKPPQGSKTSPSSKLRGLSKPPWADEMLEIIMDAGIRALSEEQLLSPQRRMMARTLGTLTACKLIFRAHNGGAGTFAGDPTLWERMEQFSDELAAANAYRLGNAGADTKVVPRLRPVGPGMFLSLVRTRNTFQWCPTAVSLEEIPPPFDQEMVMNALPFASKVWWAIYESVGQRRPLRPSDEDWTYWADTYIAELVAAGAAAKIFLAFWGNGEAASFLEWLAEEMSEEQYRLHHKNGEKSRRRARNPQSQSGPAATPATRGEAT